MKPVLIVKLGDTLPDLAQRRGDFENWFMEPLQAAGLAIQVVDPRRGADLPLPDRFSGIVLTGSHAMVTDNEAWSRRTAAWLPSAVASGVPLLGVCYGHQLLAAAMGGKVDNHPQGTEMGSVAIALTSEANNDPLLQALPDSLLAHASHTQTVTALPPGAVPLAANAWDPHHAFAMGDAAWGLQFHPEFDADIMKAYIIAFSDHLEKQGQKPGDLLKNVRETPHSRRVLVRFAEIVLEREKGR